MTHNTEEAIDRMSWIVKKNIQDTITHLTLDVIATPFCCTGE
ncbi:MAG: hypothetical protein ABFQ95_07650 [Pseudomonadota bacterium]